MSADPREELVEIARLLQNQVAWQRELGGSELPRVVSTQRAPAAPPPPPATAVEVVVEALAPPPATAVEVVAPPSAAVVEVVAPLAPPPATVVVAVTPQESVRAEEARVAALAVIQGEVRGCVACKLSQRRTNTVFARGNPFARLMFVGEGPGEQEDKQGLPFVGPAGQLLDKIITAMGLAPDDVYICNVVKCRPPGNRQPEPDEVSACTPFLARQIELVRPEAMVALGKTAAGFLLKSSAPMGKLRGHWHEYLGVPLLPTWHPSYLLREPDRKADTWADMKLVMQRLGLSVPSARRG